MTRTKDVDGMEARKLESRDVVWLQRKIRARSDCIIGSKVKRGEDQLRFRIRPSGGFAVIGDVGTRALGRVDHGHHDARCVGVIGG